MEDKRTRYKTQQKTLKTWKRIEAWTSQKISKENFNQKKT